MLVLTRRSGESLMIGDDVVVTVLDVRGDVVRIGIRAPRSVPVHREEIFRELQSANREAASPNEDALAALRRMLRPGAPGGTEGAGGGETGGADA
ncbi:carbon storage regulator CsrA [Planomonospora sp. ID91781]|uniref:carbon storage regulator CsrA n=1 Tax=Planomonospora sp. ID91781 TaxID=2738135 RepID=UPI0018C3ECA4|nr:carbon storage regulator CsrA [Planomonospora sp. ID91781]MBG0825990.1 carbon storage regulator CsrA [Planomonospora sp. ID91781]